MNSRYYNPEFGRFINADNALIQENSLIGNNLFAYCLNNPINRIDDLGNFSWNGLVKNAKSVAKGIEKTIKNTGKAVSNTIKKIGKTVAKMTDSTAKIIVNTGHYIKESFSLLGKAAVFEVGSGVGYGITVENVGASQVAETTTTVRNGKESCSLSKSSSVGYGVLGTTTTESQIISCDGKEAYSEFETKNSYSILFFEFTRDSIFYGINLEGFFYAGGHIKIGILID